ncbi:hypothetical protein FB451DRAFT_1173451 [Mycena latifolia]|nr:hypothetical protein FB451DRAFT_1173451 [Mycena latifolia]
MVPWSTGGEALVPTYCLAAAAWGARVHNDVQIAAVGGALTVSVFLSVAIGTKRWSIWTPHPGCHQDDGSIAIRHTALHPRGKLPDTLSSLVYKPNEAQTRAHEERELSASSITYQDGKLQAFPACTSWRTAAPGILPTKLSTNLSQYSAAVLRLPVLRWYLSKFLGRDQALMTSSTLQAPHICVLTLSSFCLDVSPGFYNATGARVRDDGVHKIACSTPGYFLKPVFLSGTVLCNATYLPAYPSGIIHLRARDSSILGAYMQTSWKYPAILRPSLVTGSAALRYNLELSRTHAGTK